VSDVAIKETKEEAEMKAHQVPEPSGFHILTMVPKIEGAWAGSKLVKPDQVKAVEEQITQVLYVAKVGPDAYKDPKRFPSGPWCKEGDFVLVRAYTGTRILIHGTEWRLINDDSVEGVVDDPRGISRV